MSKEKVDKGYEDLERLIGHDDIDKNKNQESFYQLLSNRKYGEYGTNEAFNAHHNEIRKYIIQEYESKISYRKISFWSIMIVTFSLLVFIYMFLFLKSETAPISFLITLTVSVFANLMALIGIVFRYVFSSTTEITDYAKVLSDREETNNKAS